MYTKLETETFAGKTIQAWRDQATKAGLVLREPSDKTDSGDYPDKIYSTLRRFRSSGLFIGNLRLGCSDLFE